MPLAITTRWNAGRHSEGEAMITEILDCGFDRVELGYDLRLSLVPGVKAMVEQNAVRVDSVHNFCPVPMGALSGHPELYTLADPDPRVRRLAVEHTSRTIRFAQEIGAATVVLHAGNVKMKRLSGHLLSLCEQGRQFSPAYEKTKLKLQITREKKVRKQLDYLYGGLEELLPVLTECGIKLAIENLPAWEAIPTEIEAEALLKHFASEHLGYWHDIGHGQVRENLGLINQGRWLERLQPYLAGMHIHDVIPTAQDHVMPPRGSIDFARFTEFAKLDIHKVFEPSPATPEKDIKEALQYIREIWNQESTGATKNPTESNPR